ncbi:MAG: hypothetical protein RLZZ123_2365 [Pseudomonadota bacterium]
MDARDRKARVLAGHRQIAHRDQLTSGCRGDALHLGNDRLRQLLQGQHQARALGKQRLIKPRIRLGAHFAQIMAGAERFALRGQYQDPALLI